MLFLPKLNHGNEWHMELLVRIHCMKNIARGLSIYLRAKKTNFEKKKNF